jgi:hypothetical protein
MHKIHKKDLVKDILEKYIQQGMDFYELTPTFLSEQPELKGFSERTLKRGRTEYKKAHLNELKTHSRTTAGIQKQIFRYLEARPEATVEELHDAFSNIERQRLVEYHRLWLNKYQPDRVKSGSMSLQRRVFEFLKERPEATMRALEEVFPAANKKTLYNYLDQWRKEKAAQDPGKSAKQRISEYLDQHPDANTQALQEAFPEIKPSSLGTYQSLWRNSRSAVDGIELKDHLDTTPPVHNHNAEEIIQALKNTVETQKRTIETLKSQNELLKKRQAFMFPELEGLSKETIQRTEMIIRTFIKGLKSD